MRLPSPRWAAAGAALMLLAGSVLQCRRETAARGAQARLWEESGAAARQPRAADRARRDPDPAAGHAALARVLFTEAFDTRSLAALPRAEAAAEARRAEVRLALAAEVAGRGLVLRPASWESAMTLGGARLLAAWRSRDGELYSRPERWRRPLRHAAELAPGSSEPARLLITGHLATWPALSPAERAAATRLVRRAFQDRDTLNQLLPGWAAVAGSRAELEAVLPAEPGPYALLQQAAAQQRDWAGFCAARGRWLPLSIAALRQQLERAEQRAAGGDLSGARSELIATAVAAPPDRRTAALFATAIERLPPSQLGAAQAQALSGWLAWALPLWQLGDEPLPPAVLARVASLSPDLPPAQGAMAALAGGDLERAEVWERRADRLWSEEWAPYASAKAEVLLARGRPDEAGAVLDEVHRTYRTRWPYLRARERLAGARSQPLAVRPDSLTASVWGPEQWLYQGNEAALDLVVGHGARALAVQVDVAAEEGGVVELVWDGLGGTCLPARQGTPLLLPISVTAGPHRLVWRTLAGGRTAPGAVELVGAGGGS